MNGRSKAIDLRDEMLSLGLSSTQLLDYVICNYLSGAEAFNAMESAMEEYFGDEEEEDDDDDVDQYEVCTFDSEEAVAEVYEGGLSYQRALVAAMQLFDDGKFFGVQVISNLPEDELDPICWIKTKQVDEK